MDVKHFTLREQSERHLASQAPTAEARAAHLELADSYRRVIEAYERVATLRATPRSVA